MPMDQGLETLQSRSVNIIHTFLKDVIHKDIEIRSEENTVYVYCPTKEKQSSIIDDRILFTLYGIMLSSCLHTIYIQDLGHVTLESLTKHLKYCLKR